MKTHAQIIELIKDYNRKIADGEVVDLDDLLNLSEVDQRIKFFKEFMSEENSILMKEELCNIVLNDESFFSLDRDCIEIARNYLASIFDANPVIKEKVEAVMNSEDEIEEAKPELTEKQIEKQIHFLNHHLKRDLAETRHISSIDAVNEKFSVVMDYGDEQAKFNLCNEMLERGGTYLNNQDWGRLVKFLIDDLNHKIISAMLRDKAKRDRFETIIKSDDTYAKQRLAKAMLDGDLVIAPARQKWEGIADVLMGELTARIEKAESMRVSKGIAKSQMLSVPAQPAAVQQGSSVDDDNDAVALVEALRTKVYGEKVSHEGAKLGLDNDAAKGKPKFAGRRAPTRKPLSERGKSEEQVAEPALIEEVVVAPAQVNTRRRPDTRASMYVTGAEKDRLMAAVQSEDATNSINPVMATASVPKSVARLGFNMGINGSAALAAVTLRRTQQQDKQINN
jgi:hypothetical protein